MPGGACPPAIGGTPIYPYQQPMTYPQMPRQQAATAPMPSPRLPAYTPPKLVARGQKPDEPKSLKMPAPEKMGIAVTPPTSAILRMPPPDALGVASRRE